MLNNALFSRTSFICRFSFLEQTKRNAVIWLCFVLIFWCSAVSSASAHTSHRPHSVSVIKKFLCLFHRSAVIRLCYITCSMLLTSVWVVVHSDTQLFLWSHPVTHGTLWCSAISSVSARTSYWTHSSVRMVDMASRVWLSNLTDVILCKVDAD
jgi:hypothetical protein